MVRTVLYILDEQLLHECDRLPAVLNRASIIQDLINSYKILLHPNVTVQPSIPATEDELKYFHSSSYLEFIKNSDISKDCEHFEAEQAEFGLEYDCPLLPKAYELIQVLAGGSLTAANMLNGKTFNIAINWFGGWHHAQRDEAEGFCYVNDVVIALQKLTESFSRILYIDLDIHHGNGVQNAFELSKKVLTLSFHKFSPGFYPGSGELTDVGYQKGKYYSLNVPLLEGCNDKTYQKCFKTIFPRVLWAFEPLAIVVQCGADGINGDPVGKTNITPIGMGQIISDILDCNLPTLFLGGGGYNFPNTARYWAYLTSVIVGRELDIDIPDTCKYFTRYKPTYELHVDAGNQKDYNTEKYIETVISTIVNYCNIIKEN